MLRGIKLPDAYQSIDKRNNWDGVSIVAAGDIPSDVYTIHQIGPFLAFTFVPLRQTRFIIFMPHYTPLSDGSLKKEVSLVFNDDPVIHHKLTFKSPEDSAQFLVTYFEMLSLTEKLISRLNPKTCFKTAEIVIALPNSKVPQRAVGEIKAIDSGYEFEIRAFSGKTQSAALSIKLTRTVSCFPSIRNSIFGKLDNIINTITIAQTYKDPFTVIMCGGPADVMSWILALYSFSSNIGRFPNRKMGFRKDDDIQRDVERVAKDFRDEEEARLKAEEEARIKAEEEARLKAEEEARLKAEEEARLKAEEEARLKAEEEARLKAEEEARLKAEEEARLKAEEEARLKAEEEARLKAEEEARLKAEEEARLKAEEEARLKAEEEARLKAEEEARLKAEEEARLKAEEEARLKAEEEARLKAEEEARLKAEEEARLKAEEEARLKAEEARLKAEEEARLKAEEEARLKAEEEARLKAEEEARLKAEEEARLKAEEEARLKAEEEARLKAEEEARLKAEEEARLKAEEEARLKAEEEARLKAEEEARLKAEEEARLKAEEEARLKAEEEARLKAEEEARLKAEEEARLKAEEEARLKAEEEARLKAEEEARLKAEEEARLKAEEEARLKAEEEARLKAEEEARLKAEEEALLKAEEEARLMTQNTNNDEISLNQTMQSELQAILDSMNPKETPILDLQFSLPYPELNFDEAVSLLDDIYQSFPEPQQRELSPISIQDSLQPTFDSPTTSFTQFASYIKSLNNCIQELIKNPNDQEQVSALVSLISALIDNGMKETSSPSSFFPQHFGKTSSEIARNALQKQSVLGVIYCLESAQKHYEEWAICRDLQTMNTINEILSQLGPIFITNELPIEESIFAKSNLFPLYNLHKIVRHDTSSDEKLLETSNEFANAIIPVVKKRSVLGFGSGDSSDFIMEACGQSHQWISPLKSQKIQGIFAEAVRRSKLGEIINDSIQNKAAVEKWLHEDSPLTDKASAEYIIRAAMFLCQRYMQSSGY